MTDRRLSTSRSAPAVAGRVPSAPVPFPSAGPAWSPSTGRLDPRQTGATRFAAPSPVPRRSPARVFGAALALLALVAGLPLALLVASGPPPVPTSWPDWSVLARTMGARQLVELLVGVVWLIWLQFVVSVVIEIVAVARGGVLAWQVPLAGPAQRLARSLVAAVLLTAALATPVSAAVHPARGPAVATAQPAPGPGAQPAAGATTDRAEGRADGRADGRAGEKAGLAVDGQGATGQGVIGQGVIGQGHVAASWEADQDLVGLKVYVVQPPQGRHHDSLWEIAQRHLGDGRRYQEIYALNHGRVQPDGRTLQLARLIQPGWLLVMPEDAVGVERYAPPLEDGVVVDPASAAADDEPADPGEGPPASQPVRQAAQQSGSGGEGAGSQGSPGLGGSGSPAETPAAAPGGEMADLAGRTAPTVGEAQPGIVAELGGSGLLGAGLLGVLLLARRRGRGSAVVPAAAEAERWLRVGADPDRAGWLDLALRGLPAACHQAGVAVPNVYAAVLDDVALELLLTPPVPQAAHGWTAVAQGSRWRRERTATLPPTREPSPCPALVSLGRDVAGRDILLQLGAAAGPVAVTGSAAGVTAVTRALAVELATAVWTDPLQVTVVDLPGVSEAVRGGRLGEASVVEAVHRLRNSITGTAPSPPSQSGEWLVPGPRPPGEPVPQHLVLGHDPAPGTQAQLLELSRCGVGILVAGEFPGCTWRLHVDDAGTLTLPELGIGVTASRLGDESLRRLDELLDAAGTPGGFGAHPLAWHPLMPHVGVWPRQAPAVPGGGSAPGPGPAGIDDAAWAAAQARVSVLGPVQVRAPGVLDHARRDQLAELVAFVALHPGGVHPNVVAGALWPRGVTADVRDGAVARARDWLGVDESGGYRLRDDVDGRLSLAPDVVLDWSVLGNLLGRSRAVADTPAEADLLDRALRLIRGPLVGGIETGSYAWLARTDLYRTVPSVVTDAAHRLSELIADGHPQAGAEAAQRGLLVEPADQRLWRDLIRCRFAQRGPEGASAVVNEMTLALARLGAVPEGPTQALLADLVPGTSDAR